jgi:predicted RNA-binding Zn ribbon-like protein
VVIVTFTTTNHEAQRPARQGHDHEVGLDETFDFLNTLEYEEGSPVDHFDTPETAIRWVADHGLVHAEPVSGLLAHYERTRPSAERDLNRLRQARAALREVTDAVIERRSAEDEAVSEVNRILRSRPVPRLDPAPDGVQVGHEHEGDPLDDALARLAEPLVREIALGRPERLRICDNDRCRWVFFDGSRTGRRRWCDMSSCGNRAKAARHRERLRKAAPTS